MTSILKKTDKRWRVFYTKQAEDLSVKLAVTKDNGALLRFDWYGQPEPPEGGAVPAVAFYTAIGEPAFATNPLVIDTDPRYATFTLKADDYPEMFRSRKVYFACVGQHLQNNAIEVLFQGEIYITP